MYSGSATVAFISAELSLIAHIPKHKVYTF